MRLLEWGFLGMMGRIDKDERILGDYWSFLTLFDVVTLAELLLLSVEHHR